MNTYAKLFAFLALGLSFVACPKPQNNEKVSLGKEVPTVIHITEAGGVDDNSFNASTWRGINRFYSEFNGKEGVHYSYMVTPNLAQMDGNLSIATDEDRSLIVVAGFNFIDAVERIAQLNPQQKYLLIDGPDFGLPNVKSAHFADEQSAFLVGALVAYKSQEDGIENPVFGFIGGMPGGVITRFEMGYLQGIKHVLGNNVTILSYYADDWANPAKAKTMTGQWINQYPNLYAIFSAAGPTGNGTIAQIKESYQSGRILWAIGVDSDQYIEGLMPDGHSVVLTSAMKNADAAVYSTLFDLERDIFHYGQAIYDLDNDGVGFSQSNTIALSEDLLLKVKALKEQIRNRDITVYTTLSQVQKAGLIANYTTDAKDD
ncbi:BMP family lipoprotein [Entomospira culicis]|uniref:BMP family ABC transporter substrate-binding protein n=1 Tax=Entomospira culicis TaxID=2719989 RepID=A0A968GI87_9SPIO|nr:BMP family ABC transporter substrate-binding protein [Entomospira culicis]NIZ18905.1 BMP family ABC transporter substrate-binding protein [Entomospira culicis]NIZ69120.1 BMP family ABC transporter substrate-binding protein [Entomospira culicis]WDI37706.1 BMP family ABC transporter substrate-binding protein [Entomospira culicis]WDI39334.1 BMP family ABC transporter substrate-binding protein [Entomospira culicis]